VARRKHDEEPLIERGSGNVFADLGFENADEMLAKAQLVHAISTAMEATGVTQTEIADRIGIDQAKVSKLLRGITDGFSSDRLLRILNSLDQDVEITIRPRPQGEHREAHVSVAILHAM
jgi:predicted XRE-type DNA-binding protein